MLSNMIISVYINMISFSFFFSVSVVASLIIFHLSGATKKGTGVFLGVNAVEDL